jgi:hypothetical protein
MVDIPVYESCPYTYRLKVSRYDRAASMLLALLILLGAVVLTLLIIWLTNQIFLSQAAVPVEMVELGTGDSPLAGGMQLEGPPREQVGLDTDLSEPSLEETLAVVADAVGRRAVLLDDPALGEQTTSGRGGGSQGDGRLRGSGRGGSGTARHWELRFAKGNTLETYARQLDFFGIELGVLMPENRVLYAYNLSKAKPDQRTGPADEEKRYYLTWRSGQLQQADRELLDRAGVDSQGRIILKFLPPQIEARLASLEKAYAGSEAHEVRKTRFGIRAEGNGYAFFVLDQSYR